MFPQFNMSLNYISQHPFFPFRGHSISNQNGCSSRKQTLFICIATFRRFIFIIFLLLEFFSSLLNQIWDLKIFSIKVWGSFPLFISRGRISPLASFHLVGIFDPHTLIWYVILIYFIWYASLRIHPFINYSSLWKRILLLTLEPNPALLCFVYNLSGN